MSSPESIDELRRRITHLESFVARFGFTPDADEPIIPAMSVAARTAIPVAEVAPPIVMPPPMPPPLPKPRPAAPVSLVERLTPPPVATPQAAAQPVAYATPVPQVNRPAADAHTGVEQAIGLKLAGWIGAIIVAIGAAMGVKFAYDQGWLGNVPPEVKLGMLYAAALAVIGLGEWAYRKVDPRTAVGIYAAGIASLFVVGYAGSAYFHLYGEVPAFGLMAAACAIGAGISLRGGFVSIAVLSHLGANVAPFVLGQRVTGEVSLLVYLLALQLMAVGLAHYGRSGRWWTLRTLALITTAFWIATRLVHPATAHSTPTILFAAIYVLIFQLELILLVRRASLEGVMPVTPLDSSGGEWRQGTAALQGGRLTFSAPTFSLAVTGFFVGTLLAWTSVYPPMPRGAHLVGLAMLLATAAAATLSSATSVAVRALATSWLTQAALLIFIAIPVSLDGPAVTFAWGGLAFAYGVLGFALKRTRTIVAGAIVWIITGVHLAALVALSSEADPLRATWLTIYGVDLPAYFIVALALGAAGQLLSTLYARCRATVDETSGDDGFATALSVLAATCWTIASLAALPPLVATAALLALAVAMSFAGTRLGGIGDVGIVLVAMKFVVVDLIFERLDAGRSVTTTLISGNVLVGVGLMIALWWAGKRSTRWSNEVWLAVTRALMFAVPLVVGSIELDRAFGPSRTLIAWSVFWSVYAVASIVLGFWQNSSAFRFAGLGLLAMTLLKIVFVDLAAAPTGWRIVSFLAVGAVLLLTSVIYGKLSPRLLDNPVPSPGTPGED